ncbi:MAG: P-loop NTPase [Gemmatimonadota bacterium]
MSSQLDSLRRYVAARPLALLPEVPERVLLVGSGKGGVGTSTIAALLAVMAAADGDEVLLVDADESHGSLPLLLGAEPRAPLGRLRGGDITPADLLVTIGHGLALLPLGGTADPAERLPAVERRSLIRRVSALYGRYDLVIVDAGSRLEQVLNAASGGVSRLLAVTAAERVSAAATYALIKTIDARQPGVPVDLLFNRCRLSAATKGYEEMARATRHFLERGLDFAGAVPEDERFRTALEDGMPLLAAAALGTPAAAACHGLAGMMVRQFNDRDTARTGRALEYSPAAAAPRLSTRR